MNQNELTEPWLSADFAAHVLLKADVLKARRRATIAGIAAVSCAAIALVSWTGLFRLPDAFGVRREPVYVVVSASSPTSQADEAEALSYLFPDAAPVARFAAQYSGADDANLDAGIFDDDDDAGTP